MSAAVSRALCIRKCIRWEPCCIMVQKHKSPNGCLVGEEGKGFRYILDGMNAERILNAPGTQLGSSTQPATMQMSATFSAALLRKAKAFNSLSPELTQKARLMVYQAADLFEQRKSCGQGGPPLIFFGSAVEKGPLPSQRPTSDALTSGHQSLDSFTMEAVTERKLKPIFLTRHRNLNGETTAVVQG